VVNWLQAGWQGIFRNLSAAFVANLKTGLLVQGQIILAPFVLIGFWNTRKDLAVWSSALGLGLIFGVMTIVFPFAGQRGGYLHSGAGTQILIWALAAMGFDKVMDEGVKKRGWAKEKAIFLFGSGLVVLLGCATGYLYATRVIGDDLKTPQWNQSFNSAREIGRELVSMDISEEDLVMINNPPGFYAATGRESVVIPDGNVAVVLEAAAEFDVKYLVLENNHPQSLDELYQNPGSFGKLEYIMTRNGVHFFRIGPEDL